MGVTKHDIDGVQSLLAEARNRARHVLELRLEIALNCFHNSVMSLTLINERANGINMRLRHRGCQMNLHGSSCAPSWCWNSYIP